MSTDHPAPSVECLRLAEGAIELLVATNVGPRIVGLRYEDGPQLFASLPGLTIPRTEGRPFTFYGGHRLWAAPEEPALTYLPDDGPVDIDTTDGTMTIRGPADGGGLQKALTVRIHEGAVIVDHTLTNTGPRPRTLAPWAITQLAVGGTAIVPLGSASPDEFQADRSLVLWPYTRWDDPLLHVAERSVEITADRTDPLKVGTALRRGWLAYRLHNQLFVKRAVYPAGVALSDLGATGQCYCNDAFIELETLGALVDLAPGSTAAHREVWEVHPVDPTTPLNELVARLALDEPSPLIGAP